MLNTFIRIQLKIMKELSIILLCSWLVLCKDYYWHCHILETCLFIAYLVINLEMSSWYCLVAENILYGETQKPQRQLQNYKPLRRFKIQKNSFEILSKLLKHIYEVDHNSNISNIIKKMGIAIRMCEQWILIQYFVHPTMTYEIFYLNY